MHKSNAGERVITSKAGRSAIRRRCSRLTITSAPKPTTPHCSACGFTASAPKCSGGRGEKAEVNRVSTTAPAIISSRRQQIHAPVARARAPRGQRQPVGDRASPRASSARLARNGCGSGGDSMPSSCPRFGSGIRHSSAARTKPGAAANRNANCQPLRASGAAPPACRWSHQSAATPPSTEEPPEAERDRRRDHRRREAAARLRHSGRRPARSRPAAPRPRRCRRRGATARAAQSRARRLPAPVASDQNASAIASSRVLTQPSASRPSGSENSA